MGLHGDPDDYGLPKVDVVIPDDARELDREVIAYRRELRQTRRRERWQRLTRPFTRYGIAAPFIAGAVLIALISGVLMTVLSPRPSPPVVQVPTRPHPGQLGGVLPSGTVVAAGKRVPVGDFFTGAGVIVIVPRACGCDAAVQGIARQAGGQRLRAWFVADGRTGAAAQDVHRLAAGGLAVAADDPDRVLSRTYHASGPTAVLVRPNKVVHEVIPGIRAGQDYTAELRAVRTNG